MSFNSITFLFWFLPVFFLLYYLLPKRIKHWALLAFSYIFYAWGSLVDLVVLLCVTAVNWWLGSVIRGNRTAYALGIGIDLTVLAFCKYFDPSIGFPLGISFFMFHAIGYLADVYHERSEPASDPMEFALYMALFTKLTMGPLVSYSSLVPQLRSPEISIGNTEAGIVRFCVGLAKKAVLAGSLSDVCELCWTDAPNSTLSAWIGIAAFSLQLYFDFSGYSDMAIGLSRMAGIRIAENFRYPYLSCSVSEFWRRWHISLGAWFRDYLYIPLGGSRVEPLRVYANLMIVWIATGIWHGSGWNFIVWGLWHGCFVCLERLLRDKIRIPSGIGWFFTLAAVLIGWVFFHSADLPSSFEYLSAMFGSAANVDHGIAMLTLHDNRLLLLASVLFATPVPAAMGRRLTDGLPAAAVTAARLALIGFCLWLSLTCIMVSGYTPFIYTEF